MPLGTVKTHLYRAKRQLARTARRMIDHLTCEAMLELIEPIAAGDVEPAPAVRAHIESARAAPPNWPPRDGSRRCCPGARPQWRQPDSRAAVLARIRRQRWQAEQRVDRLFNLAHCRCRVTRRRRPRRDSQRRRGPDLVGGGVDLRVRGDRAECRAEGAVDCVDLPGRDRILVSAVAMWWWAERRISL